MNNLLRGLAQKNNFNFAKVEPSQIPNDRFDIEKPLVQFVQETKKVNLNRCDIGDKLMMSVTKFMMRNLLSPTVFA